MAGRLRFVGLAEGATRTVTRFWAHCFELLFTWWLVSQPTDGKEELHSPPTRFGGDCLPLVFAHLSPTLEAVTEVAAA